MTEIGRRSTGIGCMAFIGIVIGLIGLTMESFLSQSVMLLVLMGTVVITYILTPAWICVDDDNNLVLPGKRVIPVSEIRSVTAKPLLSAKDSERTGSLTIKTDNVTISGIYIKACLSVKMDIEMLMEKYGSNRN